MGALKMKARDHWGQEGKGRGALRTSPWRIGDIWGHHREDGKRNAPVVFQWTVKPKVGWLISWMMCWYPSSGDGGTLMLLPLTAVLYTPLKLPFSFTAPMVMLEPRSFVQSPVSTHWSGGD